MAVYQWKGIKDKKIVSGEIEGLNKEVANLKLEEEKIIVTSIRLISGTEGADKKKNKIKGKKLPLKKLTMFTKKLSTMIKAGLPILKTLSMLESQTQDKRFKAVLGDIYRRVESGSPISDAFEEYPEIFDTIYVNIIRAGESSGKLNVFLDKLVEQLEKSEKIRSKIKGAVTYPIILICVAVGVIILMLLKVVPVFQQIYGSTESLPGPTRVIVRASEFLRDPHKGGMLLVGIILFFVGIKMLLKHSPAARKKRDKLMLNLPAIGLVIRRGLLAKIAMVQGNLSKAGVPIIESLNIIVKTTSNYWFRNAVTHVKDGVTTGKSLSALYAEQSEVIPPTFSQMLAIGEETGSMDEMLDAVAYYYEEQFDVAVSQLSEFLEPFMIVFMGLVVGYVIVALYMPIFEMGNML